jgi:hypothetical protein
MRIHVLAAIAAVALLAPTSSPAQSLGEAAAREKEKREKAAAKPPAKVITEDDLRKTRTGSSQEFVSTPAATATAGAAKPADGTKPAPGASPAPAAASAEEQAKAQADWRERMNVVQADVVKVQAEIARLEAALADNRIDQYSPSRTQAAERLAEARKLLTEAQARVATLQEQGKANGFQ